MLAPRPLPLSVGLSLVALGLISPLSVDGPSRADAVSPSAVATAPLGSRITVAGLVGDVRHFSGGGAAASIDDCRGVSARAYFPPGVEPPVGWTTALLQGTVDVYFGQRELVVQWVGSGLDAGEGALQVSASEFASSPLEYACHEIGFLAPVLSASSNTSGGEPRLVVEVAAGNTTVECIVHADEVLSLDVAPGALVTIVGVAAVGQGGRPVVHVRA